MAVAGFLPPCMVAVEITSEDDVGVTGYEVVRELGSKQEVYPINCFVVIAIAVDVDD